MTCPDLHMLSRYQDGGLDAEAAHQVREHLLSCPACEERFRLLGKMGLFLHIGLGRPGRTPCLDAEEVGAYLAGRVSPECRKQIEAHLAGCVRCLHEVAVFSDARFERLSPSSPVPTRRALAEFAELAHQRSKPKRFRRVAVLSGRVALRAAAAILLTAMVVPMAFLVGSKSSTVNVATQGNPDDTSLDMPAILTTEAAIFSELPGEGGLLVAEGASLVRFAGQMRLILQQIAATSASPTVERVGLLHEDVLNSGLIDSIEELSNEIRDQHTMNFLLDCKYVLLEVARIGRTDAPGALELLVNELRQMNLSETARLIELEGGGSLWLTAAL